MARKPTSKVTGFGEESQASLAGAAAGVGGSGTVNFKVKLGPGGRIVIPVDVRDAMGLAEGDTLMAEYDGEELKLITVATAMDRVRAIARQYVPDGVSVSDELIADRRREVEDEERRDQERHG